MKRHVIRIEKDGETLGDFLTQDAADYMGTKKAYGMARANMIYRGRTLSCVEDRDLPTKRACVRCGKLMNSRIATEYCVFCRQENQEKAKERWKLMTGQGKKPRTEVPYERKSPLSKVAWDARQKHMTYGQYVGRAHVAARELPA